MKSEDEEKNTSDKLAEHRFYSFPLVSQLSNCFELPPLLLLSSPHYWIDQVVDLEHRRQHSAPEMVTAAEKLPEERPPSSSTSSDKVTGKGGAGDGGSSRLDNGKVAASGEGTSGAVDNGFIGSPGKWK